MRAHMQGEWKHAKQCGVQDAPPEATPENAEVEETKALVAQKAENGQEEE